MVQRAVNHYKLQATLVQWNSDITNPVITKPGQRYSKKPIITNTIRKPKLKIYPDMYKQYHTPEVECETDVKQINRDENPVNNSLYARGHYSDIYAAYPVLSGATLHCLILRQNND